MPPRIEPNLVWQFWLFGRQTWSPGPPVQYGLVPFTGESEVSNLWEKVGDCRSDFPDAFGVLVQEVAFAVWLETKSDKPKGESNVLCKQPNQWYLHFWHSFKRYSCSEIMIEFCFYLAFSPDGCRRGEWSPGGCSLLRQQAPTRESAIHESHTVFLVVS